MARRPSTPIRRAWRWGLGATAGLAAVLAACAFIWRGEIWRTLLDPKQPFPTYRPPPAPDYAKASGWAMRPTDPAHPTAADPPADVFFLHPTTYDGGEDWNTPPGDRRAEAFLQQVVLPNYAGPFKRVGRVFAPRYRAASLFAYLTLRDDARDARRFAYGDVLRAFDAMLARDAADRPIVIAGAGQGAELAARLLQDRVVRDPSVSRRIAAVYLMDAVIAASDLPASGPLSPCRAREEASCTLAWAMVQQGDATDGERLLSRALFWTPDGQLENLRGRPAVCVNPLTGAVDQPTASARENLGATDATGLEWSARPAFLQHQVSATCRGGLLRVSAPLAPSLQRRGGWRSHRRIAPFNLFYADIEADAERRVSAFLGRSVIGTAAPPIQTTQAVGRVVTHRID